MQPHSNNDFLHGAIAPSLLKFTVPLALAMVLQALYGAIDMMIVGHLGTTADVSAVGTGSLITMGLSQLIVGLTTGATVCLGQAIGAGDKQRASETFAGLVRLSVILTLLLTALFIPLAPTLARLLSTPPESFRQTVSYLKICASGTIFIMGFNAVAAICRGLGDSRSPLLFVAISTVVNVIGDLILVGPCQLGTTGAAWATVFAQGISFLFAVLFLRHKGLPFTCPSHWFKSGSLASLRILKIGVPIAAQDMLNYLSFTILASIMNSLGLLASAAMGIEGKIFSFFILTPVAFMSALSAFVAQNIGAGQENRARKALHNGIAMSLSVGIISFFMAFCYGDALAGLFEKNPETIYCASRLIRGAACEHLMFSVAFCFLGYFNGKGLTLFALIQGAICAFLVRIPLALWFRKASEADLIWMGLPLSLSAAVGLALCIGYFLWQKRRDNRPQKPLNIA